MNISASNTAALRAWRGKGCEQTGRQPAGAELKHRSNLNLKFFSEIRLVAFSLGADEAAPDKAGLLE